MTIYAQLPLPRQPWEAQVTRAAPGAFVPLQPCKVEYVLSWNNLLSAGSAVVRMQQAGAYQVARAQAGTTGLARALWRYDCAMTSVMQRGPLRAQYMEHSETDARETIAYKVAFEPGQVSTETVLTPRGSSARRSTTTCAYGPMDDLQSAILYLRSQPLRTGDTITRVVQPFDRPYLATFTVLGREKRRVEGVDYPTIKIDVKIRRLDRRTLALGSFKKMKTATIWVSDDTWRLPVEMHASIYVGFISATLKKREELAGPDAACALPAGM
ncbi:MAG: DUF3108 domain-containing protein [Prosthecobacter sp.]|nr:DUF3108 domain-containing protein [Prosthecobacter sp.]